MKFKIPFFAALLALMSVFAGQQADAQVRATVRVGQPVRYHRHYRPVRRVYVAPRPRPVVVYTHHVRHYYGRPMPHRRVVYVQPVRRHRGYGNHR